MYLPIEGASYSAPPPQKETMIRMPTIRAVFQDFLEGGRPSVSDLYQYHDHEKSIILCSARPGVHGTEHMYLPLEVCIRGRCSFPSLYRDNSFHKSCRRSLSETTGQTDGRRPIGLDTLFYHPARSRDRRTFKRSRYLARTYVFTCPSYFCLVKAYPPVL